MAAAKLLVCRVQGRKQVVNMSGSDSLVAIVPLPTERLPAQMEETDPQSLHETGLMKPLGEQQDRIDEAPHLHCSVHEKCVSFLLHPLPPPGAEQVSCAAIKARIGIQWNHLHSSSWFSGVLDRLLRGKFIACPLCHARQLARGVALNLA